MIYSATNVPTCKNVADAFSILIATRIVVASSANTPTTIITALLVDTVEQTARALVTNFQLFTTSSEAIAEVAFAGASVTGRLAVASPAGFAADRVGTAFDAAAVFLTSAKAFAPIGSVRQTVLGSGASIATGALELHSGLADLIVGAGEQQKRQQQKSEFLHDSLPGTAQCFFKT